MPGAPLDGGRVVRALLWRRYGDIDRAEIAAAGAGRALRYVIGVAGLVELLVGDLAGLWLIRWGTSW